MALMFGGMCSSSLGAGCGVNSPFKLSQFASLKGRFHQPKFFHDLNVQIKTQGKFRIAKKRPDSSVIHWDIETPAVSRICIDETGLVIDGGSGSKDRKKLNFSEIGQETSAQISGLLKLMTMET